MYIVQPCLLNEKLQKKNNETHEQNSNLSYFDAINVQFFFLYVCPSYCSFNSNSTTRHHAEVERPSSNRGPQQGYCLHSNS